MDDVSGEISEKWLGGGGRERERESASCILCAQKMLRVKSVWTWRMGYVLIFHQFCWRYFNILNEETERVSPK